MISIRNLNPTCNYLNFSYWIEFNMSLLLKNKIISYKVTLFYFVNLARVSCYWLTNVYEHLKILNNMYVCTYVWKFYFWVCFWVSNTYNENKILTICYHYCSINCKVLDKLLGKPENLKQPLNQFFCQIVKFNRFR